MGEYADLTWQRDFWDDQESGGYVMGSQLSPYTRVDENDFKKIGDSQDIMLSRRDSDFALVVRCCAITAKAFLFQNLDYNSKFFERMFWLPKSVVLKDKKTHERFPCARHYVIQSWATIAYIKQK